MDSEEARATRQSETGADERSGTVDEDERPSTADIAARAEPEPEASDEERDARKGSGDGGVSGALLDEGATTEVRGRWEEIQASFVDEPRHAVQEADALVAELMKQLANSFASERQTLEGQWDRGDEVSTEELRVALQRYRSFFDRLLSA